MINAPEPALYWALLVLFAALSAGTVVRFIALRNAEAETRRKRFASLRTWWMLSIAISLALLAGRVGVCILLAVASCIAWREIVRLVATRPEDRTSILAGYGLIVINYLLILGGYAGIFPVFLPLASMLVLAVALLITDKPPGYIRSAGGMLWGILFLGYGVSHAAYLFLLPVTGSGPLGPAGWLLFLVVLTETDDIFQAVVGRLFGAHNRHRIAPVVSPNKTWEGFFGGMLVIVILAPLLAPWLTTLGSEPGRLALPAFLQGIVAPVLVALLISVAGFFGDINLSAIKRDAGVKDGSNLLPGMGGMIDRIDSLSMTAPVYVYFLIWWSA